MDVDWIPTALIGPSATRILHVLMGKETAMMTLIVREHYSVAMTIVQMATNQQEWTAVRKVSEIFVFT